MKCIASPITNSQNLISAFKVLAVKIMIMWFNFQLRLPNFLFFTLGFTHFWGAGQPIPNDDIINHEFNGDGDAVDDDNLSENDEEELPETLDELAGRELFRCQFSLFSN